MKKATIIFAAISLSATVFCGCHQVAASTISTFNNISHQPPQKKYYTYYNYDAKYNYILDKALPSFDLETQEWRLEYIKAAQELAFLQANSRYVSFENKYFHKDRKCLNKDDMILALDIKDAINFNYYPCPKCCNE